jgi:hypothetical protein
MNGAIPSVPRYVLMAWYLVKHRDNFTCTFTYTPAGERNLDVQPVEQIKKYIFKNKNAATPYHYYV